MQKRLFTIPALTVCCGFFAAVGQQTEPSEVYTESQAAAGRIAYESSCGKCHLANLAGRTGSPTELPPVDSLSPVMQETLKNFGGRTPPLIGAKFMEKWVTTDKLARRIKSAADGFKPENADEETWLKLTAYIMQANGAKAGTQPLTSDTKVPLGALNMNLPQK